MDAERFPIVLETKIMTEFVNSFALAEALPRYAQHAIPWLWQLDKHRALHPMFVSFTTAPYTLSIICDVMANVLNRESLRSAAAWMMIFVAALTPFTALFGWFFWMSDDSAAGSIHRMTIHMWLGTCLAIVFVAVGIWRWRFFKRGKAPNIAYVAVVCVLFGALVYQASLGGYQSFESGPMSMPPMTGKASVLYPPAPGWASGNAKASWAPGNISLLAARTAGGAV